MAKTNHPTMKRKKTTTDTPQYVNLQIYGMSEQLGPDKWKMRDEAILKCVRAFGQHPEDIVYGQFFEAHNIDASAIKDWRKKDESHNLAWKNMIERLSAKQQYGGLKKKLDSALVKHLMPIYEAEYSTIAQAHDRNQSDTTITLVGDLANQIKKD